jgi:Flp pilus assembly protein TadG
MLLNSHRSRRRGATLVEAAIVYPIVFLLIVCLVVVGVAVFRYQQMSWLAQEGARWASVRGYQYHTDTGNAAATQSDVSTYVTGKAAGLDTSSLTVTTHWYYNGGSALNTSGSATNNTEVAVTVNYTWVPEAYASYLPGATLTSTAKMAMSY